MPKYTYKYFIISATIILFNLGMHPALNAHAIENDLGLWTPVYITYPIHGKFKGYFEVNPRLQDNITDFSQLLIRPAFGYKINKSFSIWQGYAWVTSYIPRFRNENRIFQQLLLENSFRSLKLTHRARLEERFIENTGSTSIRGRYMLRSMLQLDKLKKWALVIYDEFFLNLNSASNGPGGGIDQNRLFVGINRTFNKNVNADIGYQMQFLNIKAPKENKLNHEILINIFLDL